MAMIENCVAIVSDLHLGNQTLTIATNFEKCVNPPVVVDRRGSTATGYGSRWRPAPLPLPSSCGNAHHQIFPVTERVFLGMAGLATDIQTLSTRVPPCSWVDVR